MAEQRTPDLVLPRDVLEKLRPFNQIQRMLLSQPGTLQRTLSAYFLVPVYIKVTKQDIPGDWKAPVSIWRDVELLADLHYGDGQTRSTIVCAASSKAQILDERLIRQILERKMGIGQAMEALGIRPAFSLIGASQGELTFSREYTLAATEGIFTITESFPNTLYGAGA